MGREQMTASAFSEWFGTELNQEETYEQTFDRINDEHEDTYGSPRYSCYDSFRVTRDRKK